MALMLILQLLTLWPPCHTDVTSNGIQEAQGPRLPMYFVPTTFYPTIRQLKALGRMFKPLMDLDPPAPYPEIRPFKPRPPIDSVPPPPNPKFNPFKPPIFPGLPPPNPEFKPHKPPIFPGLPPPNPKFKPHKPPIFPGLPPPNPEFKPLKPPIFPGLPPPNPKFKPPIFPGLPPPNPEFKPLKPPIFPGLPPPNPKFRPPRDSFPPDPYPEIRPFKPRPTIDSVPPTLYPKFRPFKPRPTIDSVPPTSYPKFRPPFDSDSPYSYPKPSLGAQPAAVVTPGINVTLTCQAPLPARRFELFKSGESSIIYKNGYTQLVEFFLEEVTEAQGGSYHCAYQNPEFSPEVWSHPSDALELLVTDQLPTPSLVALPGPVVAPGSNVSLRCAGRMSNMSFVLYRVGEDTPLQYLDSQQPWADFQLSGAHAPGTYTCYYHTPTVPYVLSLSSEPLVISSDGSGPLDYTTGNLVRLGLGGLVLIFLATLGALEWRSWSRNSAGP